MITIANTQECFVQLWRMLEPTRQPTASHSLTVPGDANGDGEVDIQDLTLLIEMLTE